jgi:hypothetical protein
MAWGTHPMKEGYREEGGTYVSKEVTKHAYYCHNTNLTGKVWQKLM